MHAVYILRVTLLFVLRKQISANIGSHSGFNGAASASDFDDEAIRSRRRQRALSHILSASLVDLSLSFSRRESNVGNDRESNSISLFFRISYLALLVTTHIATPCK